MSDKPKTEDRFIYTSEKYIKELQQKAEDAEYFRGRVHGLEYVIDAVAEALKGADNEYPQKMLL